MFIRLVLILQQIRDKYGASLNPRQGIFVLNSYTIYIHIPEYIFTYLEHGNFNRELGGKILNFCSLKSWKKVPQTQDTFVLWSCNREDHMALNVNINIRPFVAEFSGRDRRMIPVFRIFNSLFLRKLIFYFFLTLCECNLLYSWQIFIQCHSEVLIQRSLNK